MSLLRAALNVKFEPARISARTFTSSVVVSPDRQGPPREHGIVQEQKVIAYLENAGKLGVYDFTSGGFARPGS
jgi:hypothetical protein